MASSALQHISQAQAATIRQQYGAKMSNKFVEELKGTTLFQYNWGELLSAAPTALSLMGSCWLAAANPTAEKISLSESKPEDGFKFLANVPNPTLRSCLVDGAYMSLYLTFGFFPNVSSTVCHNGGRNAFTIAGANMDALQITSRRICDERIPMVFQRLGPSTANPDTYEDFKDALDDFSNDAKTCARLSSEMRMAFNKWGQMINELHVATENQAGHTAITAERTKIDEAVTKIEETHATEAFEDAKKRVTRAANNVDKQQKNLDTMIDKVPGPWASVLQSAVTSFAQAIPSLIGGAVMAKTNPLAAAGMLAGGAANNRTGQAGTASTSGSQPQAKFDDPAYATAAAILDFINHFWEYLGGDTGKINWDKFKETTAKTSTDANADADVPQGLAYILGTLKGQKTNIDVTNTAPNKKLLAAYDALIKVATELQTHLQKQTQMTAKTEPEDSVTKAWKTQTKTARDDILELAAAAKAMGSTSLPSPFGTVKIPAPDLSAQRAQLDTAMQGVQIAQASLDNAEKAYEGAVEKQEKTAKAMSNIQSKLKRLQSTGKTLEEIKKVLRDCILVLVDLIVEVQKLEHFFIMLHTVIEHIVMPRAATFEREMNKAALRATRSGVLRVDDIAKQTIYTSTLQLKAYFSLLQDIAQMYSIVHRDHIRGGVDLCYKLSKGTAANDPMPALQAELAAYTDNAAAKVAELVNSKQQEILRTLRERARRAEAESRMIEGEIRKYGVDGIGESAKRAIEAGAREQKAAAQVLLRNDVSLTASLVVASSEEVNANDL